MLKRIIAMLMAIVMLVGNVPVQAFATEEPQETLACATEGCTFGAGHTGECSTFVACGKDGCTFEVGHVGNCSSYVEPKVEPAKDAAVYVTVSNRGELGMAYEEVTVSDLNQDGKLSVDEALYAAHTVYGKGYASENGTVTKLWDVETTNVSFFVNHTPISNDVSAGSIRDGDYLVASVDQDAVNDYDKYARFHVMEKNVSGGKEFVLTLVDNEGTALAGMEIGLSNGKGTSTMLGLFTDENGQAALTLDQEGLYCVTAKGTLVEQSYNLETDKFTSIETPIIAPVCVVTVSGNAEQAAYAAAPAYATAPAAVSDEPDAGVATVAETELTWSGGTITLATSTMVGDATLMTLQIYKQGATSSYPTITNATQDGTTINITLAEDTDPSYPIQLGFGAGSAYVQNQNNTCRLKDGKGTATVAVLVKPAPAPNAPTLGSGTFTVNFSVPMGESVTVTPPDDDRITFAGEASTYKDKPYSFQISVNEGYDGTNMQVTCKWSEEDVPVTSDGNGNYTITSVPGDITIVVSGVEPKTVYNVTYEAVEGVTITGPENVYAGESCIFTVTVEDAYDASGMVVAVDGEELGKTAGEYTIDAVTANTKITVTGVELKTVYTVTLTGSEDNSYTLTGQATSYAGEPYTFTVTVDDAIYFADQIKVVVNDAEVDLDENGQYTIEALTGDTTVTVGNVVERKLFSVTRPEEAGIVFTGDESIREGKSYTFSIEVKNTHLATNMVVKVNGTEVELTDGSHTISAVDTNLVITVEGIRSKEEYSVTKIAAEGVTIDGADTILENDAYTFTVSVAEGYDDTAMEVLVKMGGEKVDLTDGYTISSVTGNLEITVSGVEKKVACNVTLPTDVTGVTVTGAPSAYQGETYNFNVTLLKGYDGTNMQVSCKCGEENVPVTSDGNGNYTIASVPGDIIIAVDGVEVGVIPTAILTGGKKPDKSWGYVDTITIDQTQVKDFVWVGDEAYIQLTPETGNDAVAKVTFKTGGMKMGAMPDTEVGLVDGVADKVFTAKTTVFDYTWNFTLHFSNKGFVPTLASGVAGSAEESIYTNTTYTLDLAPLFSDKFGKELTYFVKVNDGEYEQVAGTTFSMTPDTEGTKTLSFKANNGSLDSEDTYIVTLNVQELSFKTVTVEVPEGITPVFYKMDSFDANGYDVPGEELTGEQGTAAVGYTHYTLQVEDLLQFISVRAEGWGGMALPAEADSTVTMRQVQTSLVNLSESALEGTVSVAYGERKATAGENGKYLLMAGQEYAYTSAPVDTDYQTLTEKAVLEPGTEIHPITLKLGLNNAITITVPTSATARLYNYNTGKYYMATEVDAKIEKDNGDGTTTYSFAGNTKASGVCFIYQVSMPGKITKAGYLAWGQQNLTVTYTDGDKADTWRLDDYSGTGEANSSITEDSVLLNVNSRNNLVMSSGQSKLLKAYRAWEIIPVSYNNWIITPEFTYTILSGDGVVSLENADSNSAGEGDWKKLKAIGEGTAVVEVTYKAIEVTGGNYDGSYGASDPARTGLVVVQVGGHDDSVNFGIDCYTSRGTKGSSNISYNPNAKRAWDAEFDTLYFTGTSGQLKLSPTAGSPITEVAVSNDKGASWDLLTGEEGVYTATIKSGNNILRVTTTAGAAYQVVRGDQITVETSEVSGDKDGLYEAGETVRVTLKGLHMPIPKMAGNYNPAFGGNNEGYSYAHLNYTFEGNDVYGPGTQYNFITAANYIDVTIPENPTRGTLSLTDGYIGLGVIGLTEFDNGGDSHRNIPDAGCGTRGNLSTWHTRSILPEVDLRIAGVGVNAESVSLTPGEATVEVGETVTLTAEVLPEDAANKNVDWSSSNTVVAIVTDGVVTARAEGTATITVTTEDGGFEAACEITVVPKTVAVESVSLVPATAEVEEEATVTLTAKILPEDATNQNVTWESSDESVATVVDGVVTGVKAGNATITVTTEDGEKTAECKVTVIHVESFTVTAPAGSVVSAGTLNGSYRYTWAEPLKTWTEGENVIYKFAPQGFGASYGFIRVQNPDPDAVTYWDFGQNLKDGMAITVTKEMLFIGDKDYNANTVYRNFEKFDLDLADLYLNINEKGYLNLEQGGTFEIHAFRNWQAIESFTNNKITLPDFDYQIIGIDGSDPITIEKDPHNSAVATITAQDEGTAIVLVTYDAMYSTLTATSPGGNAGGPNRYSAIWPDRTGVFVVSVGKDGSAIATNMTCNENTMDAELTPLFYTGNAGASVSFKPEDGCAVTVSRSTVGSETLSFGNFTDSGVVTAADGTVTVSGLTTGRHIIKVEKNGLATYQVVTVQQVTVEMKDAEGNAVSEANKPRPGETVTLTLSGLTNPVEKLATAYNFAPYASYKASDGNSFRSTSDSDISDVGGTYNFSSSKHIFTITIPSTWTEDTYVLNGGISVAGMGGVALGGHRSFKYGVGKGMAEGSQVSRQLGSLPEITIPVDKSIPATDITLNKTEANLTVGELLKLTAQILPADTTDEVSWETSDAAIATVEDGLVTAVAAGEATITARAGEQSAACKLTVAASAGGISIEPYSAKGAATMAARLLSEIVLVNRNGELLEPDMVQDTDTDDLYIVELSADTDKNAPITLQMMALMHKTAYKVHGKKTYFWANTPNSTNVSNKTVYAYSSDGSVPGRVLVQPEWDENGEATLIVGLGDANSIVTKTDYQIKQYTIKLKIAEPKQEVKLNLEEAVMVPGKLLYLTASMALEDDKDYNFTWSSSDEAVATVNNGVVKALAEGETVITVTAGDLSAQCTVVVEQTEDSDETASVYFSLSDDAAFVKAEKTGTVMALQPVEVPYFDLALYGLEAYSMPAGSSDSGKPTMLHLYIYATEVFYYGLDAEEAGKGYLADQIGGPVFKVSGSPGSIFMEKLWGMDSNMAYYHNYQFPLYPGTTTGATADRVVLHDGDVVTIGHFSNWNFYNDPASVFNYMVIGADSEGGTQDKDQTVTLKVYRAGNDMGTGGANTPVIGQPEIYYTLTNTLSSGDVTTWTKLGKADANGCLEVALSDLPSGSYLFAVAGQKGINDTAKICSAPGGIRLEIFTEEDYGQAETVMDAIDAIDEEITLESETKINAARTAYDALPDGLKILITNYPVLAVAEEQLAALKQAGENQAAADAVEEMIQAIDETITLNSRETIEAARTAYDALTDAQKALVDEAVLQALLDAEGQYANLNAAALVEEKIRSIGEVTLERKEEIDAAKAAYEALTDEQKALVDEALQQTLTAAEATYQKLKEIQDVEQAILSIDETVTLESETKITAARAAYNDLDEDQKAQISPETLAILIEAEEQLQTLKDGQTNKAEADRVSDLIEAIGEVTRDSKQKIEAARAEYEKLTPAQKAYVTNLDDLEAAEAELRALETLGSDVGKIYQDTGDYLSGKGQNAITGDWEILGLARSGQNVAGQYYASVKNTLQLMLADQEIQNNRLHTEKSTENARMILALTAIGKDVTNVGGVNLLAGLNDMQYIKAQGVNGPIWTLIALDSHGYAPVGVTRDALIAEILDAQKDDGSWAIGDTLPDMTAMALTALAPYYETYKSEMDAAIDWLSRTQGANGDYGTSESNAQVVVALSTLGIDPDTDSRFIKNGVSVLDALCAYAVDGGGFKHIKQLGLNDMATEQGYYALAAYYRFKSDPRQKSLFDMSDVTLDKDAADEVDALIQDIGTVTENSGEKITAARTAFNNLTPDQKALVTKLTVLEKAESDYAALVKDAADEAAADYVENLIKEIGEVTLSQESKNKIKDARRAYDTLYPEYRKTLVDNYSTLLAAEAKLDELEDEAAASAVEQKISNIGTNITLGSESKITTARNAYNALTADQKALVSNYQTLVNAEAALNALKSTVSVTFTLLGCYKHGTGETTVHTLAGGNLQTWIAAKTYKVKPGATVKDLFEQALKEAGLTWKNPTGNYVESITRNGVTIGEFTNGTKSGWMYTLNGKHPGLGVAQQTLVNGDKVVFHYTDDYTKEEGSTSSGTTTSGNTTTSGTTNYITTTTTQTNTATAESVDRLIEDIGEEITLDSAAKIKAARAAYDKLTEAQKKLVKKYDVLVAAEKKLAELKGVSFVDVYAETGDYLQGLGTPGVGAIGGEWMVIGLARSGRPVPTGYYDHVLNYVRENINNEERLHSAKSSDNSRMILALTAIGKDVTNVAGHDLLKGLNSMDYIQKQGINGPIWALIAFDSGNYPVPEGDVSREKLIDVILEAQLDDGGWALSGERSDPDMTGMAIQALVPYMDSDAEVKKAVEEAVLTLSKMQNDNGSFSSVDGPSSESIAQVIVALAALGIDADTDARFVKNGISALDALLTYYIPGGGFRHVLDGNLDGMATEQAYYALVAYNRMKQSQNFLYDMTDVIDRGGDVVVEETTEPTEMPTEPVVEEDEDNGNAVVIWTGVMTLCAGAIVVLLLNRKKLFGKFL